MKSGSRRKGMLEEGVGGVSGRSGLEHVVSIGELGPALVEQVA
jgi:hypothetical protein